MTYLPGGQLSPQLGQTCEVRTSGTLIRPAWLLYAFSSPADGSWQQVYLHS